MSGFKSVISAVCTMPNDVVNVLKRKGDEPACFLPQNSWIVRQAHGEKWARKREVQALAEAATLEASVAGVMSGGAAASIASCIKNFSAWSAARLGPTGIIKLHAALELSRAYSSETLGLYRPLNRALHSAVKILSSSSGASILHAGTVAVELSLALRQISLDVPERRISQAKFPPGTRLYRGLRVSSQSLAMFQGATSGNWVFFRAFTSTSVDETVARQFLSLSSDALNSHRVLIVVELQSGDKAYELPSSTCAPIFMGPLPGNAHPASDIPHEGEVLFPPLTLFEIIRVEVNPGGYWWWPWGDWPLTTVYVKLQQFAPILTPLQFCAVL